MNKKVSLLIFGFFALCVSHHSLVATDLPVFYRPALFQGFLSKQRSDWGTELMARYAAGEGHSSRDSFEDKGPLFSAFGPADITRLGVGLEDIQNNTKKPTTFDYWGPGGIFTDLDFTCDEGKVDFNGKIFVKELSLGFRQNLTSGFFAEVYAPLRYVRIDNITHTIRCTNVIEGKAGPVNLPDFMRDDLPKILEENCFKLPYDQCFSRTNFSELLVSVGWQGYDDESFDIIDSLAGSMQIGAIIPLIGKKDEDRLFSIPLGYDGHWGCYGRLKAEAKFFDVLVTGIQTGVHLLFPSERTIRMKTDKQQSGWMVLEKGKASVDYGTIWDFIGYLKAENFVWGLSALLGYSFSTQEHTPLHVADDRFLHTVLKKAFEGPFPAGQENPRLINKDDIVNHDRRYRGWDQHVLHFSANYDPSCHTECWYIPFVAFEYSFPLFGRRLFVPDMIAGTFGLQFSWNF